VLRVLLRSLGVVLVHRPEDAADAGRPGDNQAMFAETTAALARGQMVALFPEGTTHDRTSLARIRTGAARIALGARSAGTARVVVVPVGVTYYDKVALRSSVLVQVGDSIDVDTIDPDDVRACTEMIELRLREITPDIEDPAEWAAIDLAAAVSLRTTERVEPALRDRARRVAALTDVSPSDRARVADCLGRYHLALASSHLTDAQVVTGAPLRLLLQPLVVAIVAVTVLAPVTLFGLAANVVPALLVGAVGLVVSTPVTKGTARVLTGLVVFPVSWIVTGVVLTDGFWRGLALFVAAPVAGFLALAAVSAVIHVIVRAGDWRLATERRAAVSDLRTRRRDVVTLVDEALTQAARPAAGARTTASTAGRSPR